MSSYWKDCYGVSSKEFIKGVIAGLEAVAIYNNGKKYVGSPEKLLKEAIAEVKEQLGWNPEWDRGRED